MEEAPDADSEKNQIVCQRMIEKSLQRNPTVKFMIEALQKAGCPVSEKFFKSENCAVEAGGGFVPQIGKWDSKKMIWLNPSVKWKDFTGVGLFNASNRRSPASDAFDRFQNYLTEHVTQGEVDQILTHELVHAYDHCRAANLDWSNCQHHACSEIRAANLSGDCKWMLELMRGHSNIRQQQQVCVRRRAQLSVSMNPHCSEREARKAVDSVWKTCYYDTKPFDRAP